MSIYLGQWFISPYFGGMGYPVEYQNIAIDDNGTGIASYAEYEFYSHEEDYYTNKKITYAYSSIFEDLIKQEAFFDENGVVYRYNKTDNGTHFGYDTRINDPRYERVDFQYDGNGVHDPNDSEAIQNETFTYTDTSGKYYFHSEVYGAPPSYGAGWGSMIKESINNPLTSAIDSYEFLGSNLYPGATSSVTKLSNGHKLKLEVVGYHDFRSLDYDASNHLTHEVRFDYNSVVYDRQFMANGDIATKHYTGDYNLAYMDSYIVRHADGSASETYLNIFGDVTKKVERGGDNSSDVLIFKNNSLVAHNVYSAGGVLAVSDNVVQGTHAVVAHQSGQTLEGGPLTDSFSDFGATTFLFRDHFGKDSIRDFDPQSGPDHDVISFVGTAAHSFSDLDIQQIGYNVRISVDANDFVTLEQMTTMHITADDFLFA